MSLKKRPKNRETFLARKGQTLSNEKKALKNTPKLYLYHHILKQHPKIVNIDQKNDFESLDQPLVKKSTKDIILSGAWMK